MESLDSTSVESTPSWTRPEKLRFNALRTIPWLGGAAVIGLSLITGMMLADEGSAPMVVSIPQPIVIAPSSAPIVAPLPAPVAVESPKLRMAVPMLAAECFGQITADGASPACSWDTGFPAISNDGRQIAELVIDGPMGPTDVSLVFYDVATNTATRTMTISKEGELDYAKQEDPQYRAKIIQRTAAAQRVLDRAKFRALRSLGSHTPRDLVADPGVTPTVTGNVREVHPEWTGATMRLLDPEASTELWRHTFSAPPPNRSNPDDECSGWELAQITGWWDPAARVVVGQMRYHNGGCMCGGATITKVFAL